MQGENCAIWNDLGGFSYEKQVKSGFQLETKYIQSLVLKKTLESISFDRRRGIEEDDGHYEVEALVNKITAAPTEVKSEATQE